MPKIIDYEARRREIADKAVTVLRRDGIQEANLGKVADLCGLGRTALYQYFRNIDELVEFSLEEFFSSLDAKASALDSDPGLKPLDKLYRFVEHLERVAILDKDRMVLVLDFLLHPQRRTPGIDINVQERVRILRAELEGLLAQAVSAGDIIAVDTKSMAFTLFAFIEAASVHSALYDNISLEETKRDIALLISGLETKKPEFRDGCKASRVSIN
jgi:AcrR family transcriptional regulator